MKILIYVCYIAGFYLHIWIYGQQKLLVKKLHYFISTFRFEWDHSDYLNTENCLKKTMNTGIHYMYCQWQK